jgi:hypothetical protein
MKRFSLGLIQLVIGLLIVNTIGIGYLTSDINFNRQVNKSNAESLLKLVNETAELVAKQGNLSSTQRQVLIGQFSDVANHGGFATNEQIINNNQLLANINKSMSTIATKLNVSK